MGSLKKRLVVGITLMLLVVATVLPVGAEDSGTTSTPTPTTITVTINAGSVMTFSLSLPIRCGNNC